MKLKLYGIYTSNMVELKTVFIDSLQDDWELNIIKLKQKKFNNIMKKKIELMIRSIKENMGNIIIWSDLDIRFYGKCDTILKKEIKGNDICFMNEGSEYINSGFIVIRCNKKTLDFYKRILKMDIKSFEIAEQTATNILLKVNDHNLRWKKLPKEIWAFSNGSVPPENILVHHANCTYMKDGSGNLKNSIEAKIEQLEAVKKYVFRQKNPKVCVVMISDKKYPTTETLRCLKSITEQDHPYSILWSMDYNSKYNKIGNIIWHSEKTRKIAIETDADYFLFVDTDVVLPVNTITELVKQLKNGNKHIISAWFKISDYEYNAGRWVADNTLAQLQSIEKSVTMVDKIDFGCMMLSRIAIEDCEFIFEDRDIMNQKACQCLSFAINAQDKGYKLWMDGDVICKHKEIK